LQFRFNKLNNLETIYHSLSQLLFDSGDNLMAQTSITLNIMMDTIKTLQQLPPEFVNADRSWKWPKKRRKRQQVKINRLTHGRVQAYKIEHGHKMTDMTLDLLFKNLTEDATSLSMISSWISLTLQRQAQEAYTLLNMLSLQETLEDYFKRFKQHCVSQWRKKEHKVGMLQASISRDKVPQYLEIFIVYRLPYEKVKQACFRDFNKQLEYWVFTELKI
jgi:hypothetical protein